MFKLLGVLSFFAQNLGNFWEYLFSAGKLLRSYTALPP